MLREAEWPRTDMVVGAPPAARFDFLPAANPRLKRPMCPIDEIQRQRKFRTALRTNIASPAKTEAITRAQR